MGEIAKQSIKGTIVTYIGVAIGFFTTFFVITRFLSAEEIGLARVLIDAATLFIGLAQLGTSSSIIRFFPYFKDRDKGHHGFFLWTLIVPLLGFAIFCGIYLLCSTPLQAWFGDKSPLFVNYYYAVLPLAFFMLYQAVFETNANVLMHIVVPRAVREIGVRLGLLVVYLLYAFEILSMDGYVFGLCLTYALAALINIAYVLSLGQFHLHMDREFLKGNPSLIRSYGLYTCFLIVSALASFLAPTLSSFFITAKMGLNFTGIFAIATYIAVIVSIPYRSLVAISQPELAQAIKDNDTTNTRRLLRQASNNLFLISGFIFLAIYINLDLIFHILPNGETYAVAKDTIILLGLGQLSVAALNIFMPALSYSRYYIFTLVASLVLTTCAIVFNNYFIPRWGMDGAALATLLSDLIYYLVLVLISCCCLKVQPFGKQHFLTLVLLLFIGLLNYAWQLYFPIANPWFSCLIRSLILLGGGLYIAYQLHLSTEIDALLHSIRLPRK